MTIKPILKWIGGKTQIITDIIDKFPNSMENYHEIFVGGGSVLFMLLYLQENKSITINNNIYAYDYNKQLINFYRDIQTNPEQLYNIIKTHYIDIYDECEELKGDRNPVSLTDARNSKESFYYWIRKCYNKNIKNNIDDINTSAMFLFLNKTCFRGMYRTSSSGFNVPFGNYKNPEVINKNHLTEIHKLIKNVKFIWCDFSISLKSVNHNNDFVYLDPPYYPENKTSFVKYTDDGFNEDKHKELFSMLKCSSFNFLMSNSYTEYILEEFNNFNIDIINVKRRINSKKPNSTTNEVLISSYIIIK